MYASSENPNDVTGGGGCLCHPIKSTDTVGPFVIFPATDCENNRSPHAVVCAGCVEGCVAALAGELSAGRGHGDVIEATCEELEL